MGGRLNQIPFSDYSQLGCYLRMWVTQVSLSRPRQHYLITPLDEWSVSLALTTIYGPHNCSGWPQTFQLVSKISTHCLVCRNWSDDVDTRLVMEGGKTVRPSIREMFWWINSIKFCGLWQVLLLIWHYDCHFGVREQRLEGGGRWKKLQTNFRRDVSLCKSSGA